MVTERPMVHAWKACVGQPTEGSNPSRSAINLLKLFLFFPNYISFLAAKDSNPPGFASADISRVNCDRELDARHLRALSFGERAAETGDHFLRGSHGSRARSGLKEIEINSIF